MQKKDKDGKHEQQAPRPRSVGRVARSLVVDFMRRAVDGRQHSHKLAGREPSDHKLSESTAEQSGGE